MNLVKISCFVFSLLVLSSCQFNLKVTDQNNKFKVQKINASNFYMHDLSGMNPDELDIYLDQKKVTLETLDISGIKLEPGRHILDVKKTKSRDPADHFEFEILDKEMKHFYLCEDKDKSGHFNLTDQKTQDCAR